MVCRIGLSSLSRGCLEQDARNGSQQARIDTLEFRLAELTLGESVSELAATDLQAVVVQQHR